MVCASSAVIAGGCAKAGSAIVKITAANTTLSRVRLIKFLSPFDRYSCFLFSGRARTRECMRETSYDLLPLMHYSLVTSHQLHLPLLLRASGFCPYTALFSFGLLQRWRL